MSPARVRRETSTLPRLLLAAVLLRSLIAPGYEFVNHGGHHDFALSVAWCPGLNGVNLTPGLEQGKLGHDHGHDGGTQDGGGEHITATCGLWTSTTSFANHNPPFHDCRLPFAAAYQPRDDNTTLSWLFLRHNNRSRAPPVPI